jgi:hypothetical protein
MFTRSAKPTRRGHVAHVAHLVLESLDDRLTPSTFTVANTNDSGPGSLRQALLSANSHAGADAIKFAIGTGAQTIAPITPLPPLTGPTNIAGNTQPGFAGLPLIELSGAGAGSGADGLVFKAGGSVVRGLVINGFSGTGVRLQADGCSVLGCFVGTNLAGDAVAANGIGVALTPGSAANKVGNATAGLGNVISGNTGPGVFIAGRGATGNRVLGNRIGTNAAGTSALANGTDGVYIGLGAVANVVGGTTTGPETSFRATASTAFMSKASARSRTCSKETASAWTRTERRLPTASPAW